MKAFIKRKCLGILFLIFSTSITVADLRDAQIEILSQQYDLALSEAAKIAKSHPIDAALISARASIELGNPAQGEKYAEFAVKAAPKSFSARLLLATAQRHQGKNLFAELNFRRALDIAQTPVDRRIARDALRYVRDTKDWNYTAFLGVAPTSNIHRQSGEFLTFHPSYSIFNQQSKPIESKTGSLISGSIQRNFRFPNGVKLVIGYSQTARRYDERAFDRDSRSVNISWSADNNMMWVLRNVALNYSNMDVANEPYSESVSLRLGTDIQINGLRPISVHGSIGHSNVFSIQTDGRQERSVRLSYPILVGQTHQLRGFIEQFRNMSREYIPDDTSGYGYGLNLAFAPRGTGFLIESGFSFEREQFQERWFIDVDRRWVEKTRATIGIQTKTFRCLG